MVWRPMSAELKFLKKDVAEHVRREIRRRVSWVHLLVSKGFVLATAVIEFKDIFVGSARLVYCSHFGGLL